MSQQSEYEIFNRVATRLETTYPGIAYSFDDRRCEMRTKHCKAFVCICAHVCIECQPGGRDRAISLTDIEKIAKIFAGKCYFCDNDQIPQNPVCEKHKSNTITDTHGTTWKYIVE